MDTTNLDIEVAVIGGGPAGLTAGIYAARAMRRTVMFEPSSIGGQISTTHLVENYPGFVEGASGPDLAFAMLDQAKRFGLEHRMERVESIQPDGDHFVLETIEGKSTAGAVILATGARHRMLDLPKEKEFFGALGVSVCATCDGAFYKDKPTVVVGGGDAAIDEGLFLTKFASKVTVVHRRDALRATPVLQERAFAEPKMEFQWDSTVEEILGDDRVQGVRLRNLKTDARTDIEAEGLFIFIGHIPNTDLVKDLADLDKTGDVVIDPVTMATRTRGIFAAGDNRVGAMRQMVTAAGDGCAAAINADKFLSEG